MRLGVVDGTLVYPETRFARVSEDLEREAEYLLDKKEQPK